MKTTDTKARTFTCFDEWALDYFTNRFNKLVAQGEVLNDYKKAFMGNISITRFERALRDFCKKNGFEFNPDYYSNAYGKIKKSDYDPVKGGNVVKEYYFIKFEDGLTLEQFKSAVKTVIENGLTSHAPLGSSGKHIILQGDFDPTVSRISQVSIRLHNTEVELLCTNKIGVFLYYGKYNKGLGVDFIAREHFRVYEMLKAAIDSHKTTL
ncbi:hypothetical protein V1389_02060 [Flavobacterium rakeshii]|uniref:hypothetical protein n=1 Tax=Flavobacterium rakeshii TaxID=1038845 RepID=UPI002E7C21E6|nr:hypothetical protein [Flavobacterium rakeshii]MEE1897101.1 hypothetical protein [Flavobacterium rakeshii]